MPISSVTSATAAGSTAAASTTSADPFGGLKGSDFLNLFITQLKNQNPLNPTSSDQFMAQTAQLSTVEGINQLNSNITQMLASQQLTQGAALIGKKVAYPKADGSGQQTGTVSAVNVSNGQVQLTVGGDSVALSQVQSIQAA